MLPAPASHPTAGLGVGCEPLKCSVPAQVFGLADRETTAFQKWTGRSLDELGRLSRLLLFRSLALQADLECRWGRSDFFWKESHRQLRTLLSDRGVWTAAAPELAVAQPWAGENGPDALKAAIVEELFVKTHLALHRAATRSWPGKPGPDSREFVYTQYICDVFDAAETDAKRQAEVLVPLADRWVEAESEAKNWKRAITITHNMIARFPQERKYPEKLILLEFQSTMDSLTSGPLKSRDARKLKAGIERIEQLRAKYAWIPLAFTLIGRLRHLRAIALANNNELSEALVESQRGMDYAPGDEEAAKTDEGLVESMKTLRARMEIVVQQVRTGYNKRLTAEGQKLANEASRGFTPVNDYIKSGERARLQQDAIAVRNRRVWIDAGYAEPAADWDASADRLYGALAEVLGKEPSDRVMLERFMHEQIAQDPLLAGLDARPATDFLARRLFPKESPEPDQTSPEAAVEALPDFKFESTIRVRGDEPFLFWLFSRQGLRLKIQASLALLSLLCALSLTGFDALRRVRQDQAYRAVIAASNDGDFSRVIQASEDFLGHPALHHDDRTPQVRAMYSEALVRWFSLVPGTPDQSALKRLRRYKQLIDQVQ